MEALTKGLLAAVLAVGLRLVLPAPAAGDTTLERALAASETLSPEAWQAWLRLGHYEPAWLSRYESEVDGPAFFLTPAGKRSPKAELRATLIAFLTPGRDDSHAICRFPARFLWALEHLPLPRRAYPEPRCQRLIDFYDKLKPAGASLVFSAYDVSSPASAFGHTLIRIHHADRSRTQGGELLDRAITYGADVDTPNALAYAFKGLTGMFTGSFKSMPFYYKVREYNDYEARDTWEYTLALDPKALQRLVAHIWELGATYVDYYYLSDNCAHQLLRLIEVADPHVTLVEDDRTPSLPADIVKLFAREPGLVTGIRHRPSLRTQFYARYRRLDRAAQTLVRRLAAAPDAVLPSALPSSVQAQILDAAITLVHWKHAEDLTHEKDTPAARRKHRLETRRAALAIPSPPLDVEQPARKRPDIGHGSRRFELAGGYSSKLGTQVQLGYRVALHDLSDASPGYPERTAIDFLDVRLRVMPEIGKLAVDDSKLLRILSLHDFTRLEPKIAWEIDAGATYLDNAPGCTACTVAQVKGGTGFSKRLFGGVVTAYALLEGAFWGSPQLDGIGRSGVRLGVGTHSGLRIKATPSLLLNAYADWFWLPGQQPTHVLDQRTTLRWIPYGNFFVGAESRVTRQRVEGLAFLGAYH